MRSRQLSASSPASLRASGGARVCARWRGGRRILTAMRCVFIREGTAQRSYAGAPGGSHLRDTWQTCNTLEVVHVPTHAWTVGWSFWLLRVSGNKDITFKTDSIFVSISSADKDTEKTFDSFNRMHMIWIDRS